MSRIAYPQDSDVQALCVSSAVTLPSGLSFAGMAQSAIDAWEHRTGYRPFLSAGVAETRSYDPPGANRRTSTGFSLLGGGRVLDLDCGLIALTAVNIGVFAGTIGTVLLQGTDYWLEPYNAPNIGDPWQRVRFRAPVFGFEQSVQVVGIFGYGLSIPEEVWQAIVRLGAAIALEGVAEGLKSGAVQWQEDRVKEEMNPQLIATLGKEFRSYGESMLRRYRRVGFSC